MKKKKQENNIKQNSKTRIVKTRKKTETVTKFNNSDCDKTEKLKLRKKRERKHETKLKKKLDW